MAISILSRRLIQFLRLILTQSKNNSYKLKVDNFKSYTRNLSARSNNQKNENASSVLYKINLAHFYNGSKPMYNVSTYENLVHQKSTANADKKCSSEKPNPGRHKFHKEIEDALNDQIEVEFNASFAYLAMASYYGRSEVALPGCQGYFMMMHEEEHEHAIILLNYILMRGGHVKIPCICPPENHEWENISKTFAIAVEMESQVKEKLEALVELSEKHRDHQLVDFISSGFLEEQNKSIQTMSRLLTRSKMINTEVGEHLFDQHLYDSFVKHSKDNMMYTTDIPQEEEKKVYK